MDEFTERVFLKEVVSQIGAAYSSVGLANRALGERQTDELFGNLANFLNHAGVVGKILRPSGGKDAQDPRRIRGGYLRERIGISDDEIALNRDLRDLLEHIDEQFDKWAEGGSKF